MKLNLQANNDAEKRVLEYLENNASEALASKIKAGVQVEKEGKQLLSKKDLNSFFVYAQNEARKIANNNQYDEKDEPTYGMTEEQKKEYYDKLFAKYKNKPIS